MYGDINKLFQCFVELVFFYFLFAHNIYSKLQHCFSVFKPLQSRALQDISEFSQYKPKCLNTAQVACPQHWSRMSGKEPSVLVGSVFIGKGWAVYHIKVTPQCPLDRGGATVQKQTFLIIQQACKELPPLGSFLAGNQYQVNIAASSSREMCI